MAAQIESQWCLLLSLSIKPFTIKTTALGAAQTLIAKTGFAPSRITV